MNLYQRFAGIVRQQELFQSSDLLLLAVSGGVDSVVLSDLCHHGGYKFAIAHVNFGLRGKESDQDEQFVRSLADRYRVPVHVKLFDTQQYCTEKKISVQTGARELRYNWFRELHASGFQWLLTAHHADDNIETVLMNFFRGTGISGLRGILPKSGHVVRPLLNFTKQEILEYAEQQQLLWREDSSNASEKYSRNYFRNKIIPLVQNIYPETETSLLDNIVRFREGEELYRQSVGIYRKQLLQQRGDEIHIPVLKLKKVRPLRTIVFELTKEYGFSARQSDDVAALLHGEHGKYVKSDSHRIIRNRNWLILAPIRPASTGFTVIEKGQDESANGWLTLKHQEQTESLNSQDNNIVKLDASKVEFPLIFRSWKQGDYFYPLGMQKKKKVSRFLIDKKLSPTEKERVMVLESNKRICWVAGYRIDDRFKVGPNTRKVIEFQFRPHLLK